MNQTSKGQELGIWYDALVNVQKEIKGKKKVPKKYQEEITHYVTEIISALNEVGLKVTL